MTTPWWNDAQCADIGPEIFFPDVNGSGATQRIAAARSICADCPVATQCLDYALSREGSLSTEYRAGIWAGTTPSQRYELYRQANASKEHPQTAAVLDLSKHGLNRAAIGRRLHIDHRTVKAILERAFAAEPDLEAAA